MRLTAPTKAPYLDLVDIYGKPVPIGTGSRRTLLCFFRDAACPFCNFQIYQLTQRYPALSALGLDIVAVFTSTPEEVKRFVSRHPRPFPVVADPTSTAHTVYGIESSFWRKLKAMVTRVPTLIKGLRLVGMAGLNTTNLMPADFLIDEDGNVAEAYYGNDAGDHIPFARVESFLTRRPMKRPAARRAAAAAKSSDAA
jgi:peroxiredoxin